MMRFWRQPVICRIFSPLLWWICWDDKDEQSEIFKYAAGGFRDFTRIASSDPTMWLDICSANKNEIIPLIQQLKEELDKIERTLENDDSQQLFETFTYARNARQRFLRSVR